jgi:hypothetical protein
MATRQERCHGRKAGKGRRLRRSRRELLMPASSVSKPLVSAFFWYQQASSVSKFLASAKASKVLVPADFLVPALLRQQSSGASPPASAKFLVPVLLRQQSSWCQPSCVSKVLVPANSWCQQSPGASQLLVPANFWCQPTPGVSKVLVPACSWCQQSPGVSEVLVPARSWCQQSPGTSPLLVSAKSWCQQSVWCQHGLSFYHHGFSVTGFLV